ncbi:uncharacterized protein C8Q71DRAFT_769577 [Rhodofomes roseus]|uniref:Transmembrane protein n=1 Tax=Rhodofomes roseus TaxID=34475 RepID=A0ABQ8KAZ3_9APHY|nr:uncharacterized protein C8Q71DRAFT_769577 [Rhodofomes roseus]KAH9834552.1 hypothetical protein C8Q71DRAFT_769577 [Rhodofomes roseus]
MPFNLQPAQVMEGMSSASRSTALDRFCAISMLTLFIYERILVSKREVRLILIRSFSLVSCLYVAMNVLVFVYLVLHAALSWDATVSCESPYIIAIAAGATASALYLIYGTIAALRVYAINGRNYIMPSIILTLFIVGLVGNVYYCVNLSSTTPQAEADCVVVLGNPHMMNNFDILLHICNVTAEALVLFATWRKTYSILIWSRTFYVDRDAPLTWLLLRDGTMYFSVLLALNIVTSVLWVTDVLPNATLFFHTLSTILLSHFFMNLREAASPLPSYPSSDLYFGRSVLGNIGNTLSYKPEDEVTGHSDDEDEEIETEQRTFEDVSGLGLYTLESHHPDFYAVPKLGTTLTVSDFSL